VLIESVRVDRKGVESILYGLLPYMVIESVGSTGAQRYTSITKCFLHRLMRLVLTCTHRQTHQKSALARQQCTIYSHHPRHSRERSTAFAAAEISAASLAHRTAGGAVGEVASGTAVNLERLAEKEAALAEILELFPLPNTKKGP
jgi:hypothetical protein